MAEQGGKATTGEKGRKGENNKLEVSVGGSPGEPVEGHMQVGAAVVPDSSQPPVQLEADGSSASPGDVSMGTEEESALTDGDQTADDEDLMGKPQDKEKEKVNSTGRKQSQERQKKGLEPAGSRTKYARLKGKTLLKTVEEMETRTNAKVYLKCQYRSEKQMIINFCYGSDFELLPGGQGVVGDAGPTQEPERKVSQNDLRTIVHEGVAEALASQGSAGPSAQGGGNLEEDAFNSPSVGARKQAMARRRSASGSACQQCFAVEENVIDKSGIIIPAKWFHLSFASCRGRVHNECIGFPHLTQDDIPAPWYCFRHVGCGRPPIQDEDGFAVVQPGLGAQGVASANSDQGKSTEKPQGKEKPRGGRGGGRGRGGRGKSGK